MKVLITDQHKVLQCNIYFDRCLRLWSALEIVYQQMSIEKQRRMRLGCRRWKSYPQAKKFIGKTWLNMEKID